MQVLAAYLALSLFASVAMADDLLVIDERRSGDPDTVPASSWRLITDGVMGGVSHGRLTLDRIDDRDCMHLRGDIRLDNGGGFVQAAITITPPVAAQASGYSGVLLEVYGNAERYNAHLRTGDTRMPWQAYRAGFHAPPD